ncbi:hypothetical protein [Nocardia alni]|uniref:hypothetical protein n=1 Tax=Nocardia alni TaxID=2815723 RepID=UPI001C232CA1|nr:hypothetical protein [Nocardia alni]
MVGNNYISLGRRWLLRAVAAVFGLVVFPGVLGATARAGTGALAAESSTSSALGWMHITDTYGVQLSNYLYATNHGSLLNPGDTAVSTVLGLEFAGWKIIVTTAIWLIGYALSFSWLQWFAKPLTGIAHSLSGQIATPIMLVTAAAIGAFFVAYFVVRGHYSKATLQVATMLAVAVIGPLYLAAPLADTFSSDGLLAQGRNLGISVAAGLDGQDTTDPTALVATMQGMLADDFARHPLQVWNFGHVIDNDAACRAAWSAGVAAGSETRVKNGLAGCGDSAAQASANNPSFDQIGTGLLILLLGALLLLFGAYLAIKIIKSALDTIYHGLLSIFGFAAGGFVYGVTQTFLVRNMVDGVVAAARMTIFTVFLGVYVLFLGDLFDMAGGEVMAVFVVGGIVEVIAISQLRRIGRSLEHGNEWLANKFALGIQGGAGSGTAGSGGGAALGMGAVGASHSLASNRLLVDLAAAGTFNNSPVTEWLFGTRTPLRKFARREKAASLGQWGFWGGEGVGGETGFYAQSYMNRRLFSTAARQAAERAGGVNTVRGAAAALTGLDDVGGKVSDAYAALTGAGFTNERVKLNAIRSWGIVEANSGTWTLGDKRLGRMVAAVQRAQDSSLRLVDGTGDPEEVAADLATLQAAAFSFQRANPGGVTLDAGAAFGPQRSFVTDYMTNPAATKIKQLQQVANGDLTAATGTLAGVDQLNAERMLQWIGNRHAELSLDSVDAALRNPSDPQRLRDVREIISAATDTDQWASGAKRTPWNSLAPPGANPVRPGWAAPHARVGRLLNR